MTAQPVTDVILEIGKKRVFACAAAWPGWCRSGRSEELALETLAAYLPRYAPVARLAGLALPPGAADAFAVTERLPGTAGYTDSAHRGRSPRATTARWRPTRPAGWPLSCRPRG